MYVYILQSIPFPGRYYTGKTVNPKHRLEQHNAGENVSTAKHRPWKFIARVWFEDERKAFEFERYLKSGSGVAFSMRHFR